MFGFNLALVVHTKYHLEDPRVYGRIILRWIFRMWFGGIDWFDVVQDGDTLRARVKYGNEPLGSVPCGEFAYCLRNRCILKKDSDPWSK
jgi:hypothetical protein